MEAILVKNYNKYLGGTKENPEWIKLGIHRFDSDFDKLIHFDSHREASRFLDNHPKLEKDFDGWIVKENRASWNHGTHGGPTTGPSYVQLRNLAKKENGDGPYTQRFNRWQKELGRPALSH